jgi:hypothetical protein
VRRAFAIEQNVARLKIAVKDAALVGVVNGAGDGGEELCSFPRFVAADVRRL